RAGGAFLNPGRRSLDAGGPRVVCGRVARGGGGGGKGPRGGPGGFRAPPPPRAWGVRKRGAGGRGGRAPPPTAPVPRRGGGRLGGMIFDVLGGSGLTSFFIDTGDG